MNRGLPLALALSFVALASMLVACSKPLSSITVFSGSTAKLVPAQPACFLTAACGVDSAKITELTARGGGQILVDVDKKLADLGWVVAAFNTDATGKNTPVPGAGSPTIDGAQSIRLNVPVSTGGYFLQIAPIRPSSELSTWLVAVKLTQ